MVNEALGMVETKGLVGAIEALISLDFFSGEDL